MLFTPPPPPPLPTPAVSSSVKNESSSATPAPSSSDDRYSDTRSHTISSSTHPPTSATNGPRSSRFLSANQSRSSQLPDQDWFYSPSSSRPSIHYLTPTSTKIPDSRPAHSRRRVSCPVGRSSTAINKRESRFRFPSIITSSTRDARMTNAPTKTLHVHQANETSHSSKSLTPTCTRPSSIFLPIANPVAAAALVEDDEPAAIEVPGNRSLTPSPLDSPRGSAHLHRTPNSSWISRSHNKAILNVGGVRHEGNERDRRSSVVIDVAL